MPVLIDDRPRSWTLLSRENSPRALPRQMLESSADVQCSVVSKSEHRFGWQCLAVWTARETVAMAYTKHWTKVLHATWRRGGSRSRRTRAAELFSGVNQS